MPRKPHPTQTPLTWVEEKPHTSAQNNGRRRYLLRFFRKEAYEGLFTHKKTSVVKMAKNTKNKAHLFNGPEWGPNQGRIAFSRVQNASSTKQPCQ